MTDRQVFRLKYPDSNPARLETPLGEFEVFDCSEGGLCYRHTGDKRPEISRSFQGRLMFNSGDASDVYGFVVWIQEDRVAVRFSKSISPALIMNEQRWLRDHAEQPT